MRNGIPPLLDPNEPVANAIEERLRALVATILGVAPETVTADVSLFDDLAADSLDLTEISLASEEQLGVRLPEDGLDAVRTYRDFVELVFAQVLEREAYDTRA